jgi:hypothetical protein
MLGLKVGVSIDHLERKLLKRFFETFSPGTGLRTDDQQKHWEIWFERAAYVFPLAGGTILSAKTPRVTLAILCHNQSDQLPRLDQIEGVQEHVPVMLAVADTFERRDPVVIARDGFPIDDARARAQANQSLHDQREAMGEIIAGAAVEPHAVAILASDDAKSVVLYFVQP